MDAEAKVQSPFLPGTQIQFAWDSTSLGYLKTCPRLYQYTMLEGWGSRDESVHLRFGIEYHSALQDFDIARAEGAVFEDAMNHAIGRLYSRTGDWVVDTDTRAGKYKNRETLLRTVIDYLDNFREDPAKTVILDTGKPAVELSFKFELDWKPKTSTIELECKVCGGSGFTGPETGYGGVCGECGGQKYIAQPQPYLLSGHLDRIVEFSGEVFIMDRKTTTTTPSAHYFNQYAPNNQMTLYTLASQVVFGTTVKGVIIDAAQILVDSSRFVRGFTYRTPDQIDEWLADLKYWLALAEEYASAAYWPMNDTACDKFGGCRFREICSKSPQVRERFLEGHFDKLEPEERWNPLKPR